jgi:hypothetical protein
MRALYYFAMSWWPFGRSAAKKADEKVVANSADISVVKADKKNADTPIVRIEGKLIEASDVKTTEASDVKTTEVSDVKTTEVSDVKTSETPDVKVGVKVATEVDKAASAKKVRIPDLSIECAIKADTTKRMACDYVHQQLLASLPDPLAAGKKLRVTVAFYYED